MSVRWKFLILFMIFSLAPLVIVTIAGQRGITRMGDTISGLAKKNRTEIVSRELQQTAADYAKILEREEEVLELTLRIIVREAERLLAEPPKGGAKVYFAENYDNPDQAPKDLVSSPRHLRRSAAGRTEPIPVSYGQQVFFIKPKIDRRFVKGDVDRLSGLLHLHQELDKELGDILYWQYVSLESGVQAAYPGHGGYPSGYDPQNSSWYTLAKERGTQVWIRPHLDASTSQVIMTVSMPVRYPDGSFAGVAGIDVLLSKVLQVSELSSQWSPTMRSFLVWAGHKKETGEFGLWIIAQKDYLENAAAWSRGMGLEQLAGSDAADMDRFVEAVRARKSGYVEMDYYGVDSVWAHAHAGEDLYLILIVPKRIILEQFERVRGTLHSLVKEQWLLTGVVAIVVIILLILAGLWFAHAMIRPLSVMVEAVERLARGDFSARINISTGDERDLVAKSFNEMVPQLQDRMQMRKALEVAQEVQQNLLPQEIPDLPGFDIAAKSVYCDETGGDYFDFFPCKEENCQRFGIVVGDVTGHGVGAALLMATARALVRGLVTQRRDLAGCITRVNTFLAADVRQTGRFMSLFFLMIEGGSPTISWVRAGHDPAMLYDPDTDRFEELLGPGMVLGVEEKYSYQQTEKTIEAVGTIILIGTDGIWEAHNGEGEMFGKKRLYDIIRASAAQPAEAIQTAVLEAISNFRGQVPQEDDITLVVIKML